MLASLHIENIAVIECADIVFSEGFNVLTGETGAGKSMVIDAICAVLGERARRDLVRAGTDQAEVTAVFEGISGSTAAALSELGCEPDEDGSLMIRRVIAADGRSRCLVNGRPITASVLRQVGRRLVNIHGQHENQALLDPDSHLSYLDRAGELHALREHYAEAYHEYCALRRRLKAADMDETYKQQQQELLSAQIQEIEQAQITVGEYDELTARRTVCRNAERIAKHLNRAAQALSGSEDAGSADMGAVARVSDALEQLSAAAEFLPEAATLAERIQGLYSDLEDCAADVSMLQRAADVDEGDLDALEDRLALLTRLLNKYGGADRTETAVLDKLEQARAALDTIETSGQLVEQLTRQAEQVKQEVIARAAELTEARRQAADRLAQAVMNELTFLNMPQVRFAIDIQPVAMTATGGDRVSFLMSANVGEDPKPIDRIASGGELSRIMLALKAVMAGADDIDTLIFDEIDNGISGRTAQRVGVKLRQIAGTRQVLCVTHLAQIAAQGHTHYLISKAVRGDRTYTDVTVLDDTGREQELARIIGGETTDANLLAAREMLRGG